MSNIGRGEKEVFLSILLTGVNTIVAYFAFPLQIVVKKGLFHGQSNCVRVEKKVFHRSPKLDGVKKHFFGKTKIGLDENKHNACLDLAE